MNNIEIDTALTYQLVHRRDRDNLQSRDAQVPHSPLSVDQHQKQSSCQVSQLPHHNSPGKQLENLDVVELPYCGENYGSNSKSEVFRALFQKENRIIS